MERYGCFGGVITTVGMETIAWYRYEGTVESEGIGIEMSKSRRIGLQKLCAAARVKLEASETSTT